MAAPDPNEPGGRLRQRAQRRVALRPTHGQTTQVGPDTSGTLPGGGAMNRNVRTMPLHFSPVDNVDDVLRVERGVEEHRPRPRLDADLGRPHARDVGRCQPTPANTRAPSNRRRWAASPRSARARARSPIIWAGTDDGVIQVTRDGGATWTQRHAAGDQAVDAHLQHRSGPFRSARRLRRRQHAAPRRNRAALLPHARRRQDVDRDQHRHQPATRSPTRFVKIRGSPGCSTPAPTRRSGCRSTMAITGSRCGTTCRRFRCAICRSRTMRNATAPI